MLYLFLVTYTLCNVCSSRVLFPIEEYQEHDQTVVEQDDETDTVTDAPIPSPHVGAVRPFHERESRYSFVNARGVTLVGNSWTPDVSPVGLVYISHGYGEHMDYYDKLGTALAEAGLYAFGHDHEGHGRSGGDRVNIADFQFYVDDIFQHIELWQEELAGELPVYVVGHSMGGLAVTLACIERQGMFKGAVLTGPLIRSEATHGEGSNDIRILVKAASKLSPSFQIRGSRLPVEEITSNPYYIQQIIDDPLFWKGQSKTRQAHATFLALDRVAMQFKKVLVPLLVLHGSEDMITQPEGSRLLVTKASSADKEFIEMEGMKHHLVLELDGIKIIRKIVTWIISRL